MDNKIKVLLIGSESFGRGDEILGLEIMVNFLKALLDRKDRPQVIIFWNTGVKLLVEDSPIISYLRALEEKGVKLLAGQLCVNELGLSGKIALGKVASINEILDLILNNDVLAL